MLLNVNIVDLTIGNKKLFDRVNFSIEKNEKIAIIGRNGVGKTTLFKMLTNFSDNTEVQFRRGTRVISTAQENHSLGEQNALDYIINNLPDYAKLKHIIDTFPSIMGEDIKKIETYSDTLEHFSSLGYYNIEDEVLISLMDYQISEEMAKSPMKQLSGGQKRFVELVRIEHSNADLALIDEPTNHMDYIAKAAFINWLKNIKYSVVVISHDRDVLNYVDRIIEIKDGAAKSFKGNYDAYLKQNASSTATQMHDYETGLRTLENLHKQIQSVRAKKASTSKTPNPFIPLERRLLKQYEELESRLEKPTFWIDRESAENMNKKVNEHYHKYKAKNIRLNKTSGHDGQRELLKIEEAQLSYSQLPLFEPVSFSLNNGDRLQLVGRNGAGKTTLIKAITEAYEGRVPKTLIDGHIRSDSKLRLSVYDQEIPPDILSLTLYDAIEQIYREQNIPSITDELIKRTLSNYLFNPYEDGGLLVEQLSGGQKARLQIIKMLANNPNLLILDEPTNHLDLPSIEELENALANYSGAVLYISHDSLFAKNIGGETINLKKAP